MKKILKTLSLCCSLFLSLSLISSCQNDFIEDTVLTGEEEQGANQIALIATIIDGLYENWNKGDVIMLLHNGRTVSVEAQENGITSNLSGYYGRYCHRCKSVVWRVSCGNADIFR